MDSSTLLSKVYLPAALHCWQALRLCNQQRITAITTNL
jgi:hypothetical protein